MDRAAAGDRHADRLAGRRRRLAGRRHRHRARLRERSGRAEGRQARAARHLGGAGRSRQRRGHPARGRCRLQAAGGPADQDRSPPRPTSTRRCAKRDTADAALNRIKALIAQKVDPGAVRRPPRHPPRRARPVRLAGPRHGDAAGARSDLGRLSRCPSRTSASCASARSIELTVDAFPGKVFKGKIASLDARVSQETRTLLVRGTLANPERTLLPGMFANVAVLAGAPAEGRDRAAHGRHLQPLRRQRLRGEAGRRAQPAPSPPSRRTRSSSSSGAS